MSTHVADLAHPESAQTLIQEVLAAHGQVLNWIIFSAGCEGGGGVGDATLESWGNAISVNLGAAMRLSHAAMPALCAAGAGCVVTIGSLAAHTAFAGGEACSATKAGRLAFNRCLFESVREAGVKVCTILPGFVNTAMASSEGRDRSHDRAAFRLRPALSGRSAVLGSPEETKTSLAQTHLEHAA